MTYSPPNKKIWEGRQDSLPDERFFQRVHCIDLTKESPQQKEKNTFAIIGFACDEGIKRNLGRPGANEGPTTLRQALVNLSLYELQDCSIYDVGDIVCDNNDLESAQTELAKIVCDLLNNNIHPLVIGGGHELAWGHYQGIAKADPTKKIKIINFDAHFDMRPLLSDNKGSSGTPFLQIANAYLSNHQSFDYQCIGIQQSSNTRSLFQTAKMWRVNTIFAEDIQQAIVTETVEKIDAFIKDCDTIYLTLCLDVLAAAYAPGVSAPQPLGLEPWKLLPLIKHIASTQKVISFDIAELSPPHDHQQITGRLAATILLEYMRSVCSSNVTNVARVE